MIDNYSRRPIAESRVLDHIGSLTHAATKTFDSDSWRILKMRVAKLCVSHWNKFSLKTASLINTSAKLQAVITLSTVSSVKLERVDLTKLYHFDSLVLFFDNRKSNISIIGGTWVFFYNKPSYLPLIFFPIIFTRFLMKKKKLFTLSSLSSSGMFNCL